MKTRLRLLAPWIFCALLWLDLTIAAAPSWFESLKKANEIALGEIWIPQVMEVLIKSPLYYRAAIQAAFITLGAIVNYDTNVFIWIGGPAILCHIILSSVAFFLHFAGLVMIYIALGLSALVIAVCIYGLYTAK
jgi:hypothetical protein